MVICCVAVIVKLGCGVDAAVSVDDEARVAEGAAVFVFTGVLVMVCVIKFVAVNVLDTAIDGVADRVDVNVGVGVFVQVHVGDTEAVCVLVLVGVNVFVYVPVGDTEALVLIVLVAVATAVTLGVLGGE